ncbi:MAG: hypothetical protein V4582_22890 [Pseudomonadota bacterium]
MIAWTTMGVLARQPLYLQRSVGSLRLSAALACAVLLFPLCALFWHWRLALGALLTAVPLGSLLLLWWGMALHTGLRINTPANARLHPRMLASLRALVGLYLVGATALLAALLALVVGHFWLCWSALVLFFSVGTLIAGGGQLALWIICLTPFALVLPDWPAIAHALAPLGARLAANGAPACAGALGVAALSIAHAFPGGGERHWRAFRFSEQLRAQLAGHQLNNESGIGMRLYGRALRRDCAAGPSTCSASAALVLHVLGPALHWSRHVVVLAVVAALAPGALLYMHLFPPADARILQSIVLFADVMAAMLAFVILSQSVALRMSATRQEQALLRLTARAPQGRQLNRVLARALLRRGALWWLAGLAYVGVLAAAILPGWRAVVMVLSLHCLALPLLAGPLRDFSAMRDPLAMNGQQWMMGNTLLLLLGFLALHFGVTPLPWPLLAALAASLAAGLLTRGWRRMLAAPVAFPAQRLAR